MLDYTVHITGTFARARQLSHEFRPSSFPQHS